MRRYDADTEVLRDVGVTASGRDGNVKKRLETETFETETTTLPNVHNSTHLVVLVSGSS